MGYKKAKRNENKAEKKETPDRIIAYLLLTPAFSKMLDLLLNLLAPPTPPSAPLALAPANPLNPSPFISSLSFSRFSSRSLRRLSRSSTPFPLPLTEGLASAEGEGVGEEEAFQLSARKPATRAAEYLREAGFLAEEEGEAVMGGVEVLATGEREVDRLEELEEEAE
jgi:hypothetical protein